MEKIEQIKESFKSQIELLKAAANKSNNLYKKANELNSKLLEDKRHLSEKNHTLTESLQRKDLEIEELKKKIKKLEKTPEVKQRNNSKSPLISEQPSRQESNHNSPLPKINYHYADTNGDDLTDHEEFRQSQLKRVDQKTKKKEEAVDCGGNETENLTNQSINKDNEEEAISIDHLEQGYDFTGEGGQIPFGEEMFEGLDMDPHYDNSEDYPKNSQSNSGSLVGEQEVQDLQAGENQEQDNQNRRSLLRPQKVGSIIDRISEAQTVEENKSSVNDETESRKLGVGSTKDIKVDSMVPFPPARKSILKRSMTAFEENLGIGLIGDYKENISKLQTHIQSMEDTEKKSTDFEGKNMKFRKSVPFLD